jgi:iron complex outermembrane receptor protein
MKQFYVLMLSILSINFAYSQNVTGNITDTNGAPLPNVNIIEQGTSNGVVTDFDGNYSITVDGNATLVFSYVGFDTQEVLIEGQSSINVIMTEGVGLDEVSLVGTRNKNRVSTDTPVPVDVLDIKELVTTAPQVTLNQILNYAAPSFSSNTQTISDGTDHIDPASLRGLGPDQVLVLINGKRRHKTSLVNINGTFGRGSVGTDLNSIPSSAIKRVEILRDGAAAQYGSDAIAGVINIVLNTSVNELNVSVDVGANMTKVEDDTSGLSDNVTDGEQYNIGINYGIPLGEKGGYINFTGAFNFRGATNRMLEWEGGIFNQYNAVEWAASQDGYDLSLLLDDDLTDVFNYAGIAGIGLNGDETLGELQTILGADDTDSQLAARGQTRSDYNMRVGQSELRNAQFFANMSIPVGDDMEIYAFGGLGYRNGEARGFYRLPSQSRAYTPAYINGFLPQIHSNIRDKSISAGIRGAIGDWDIDFSNTWGINSFLYNIRNSSNASLGNSTPFEANAGGYSYSENTTNFDMSRYFDDVFAGLNVAFGAEYRLENYIIEAGDENSYAQYNTNGNVHDPTDPNSVVPTDFFGNTRPGGIQVFPGFKPANEVDESRNSIAAYIDTEADFSDAFMVSAAVRFENFSDFGSTTNFKLASRVKATDNISIRAGLQTGFRAPSLHQINFNSTSTIFVDGVPEEVGTFSNTSRVARILGIEKLKEETSFGFSAGVTAKIPSANMKITVDGYIINIDDRVVYTGSFARPSDPEAGDPPLTPAEEDLQVLFDQANASAAAFFANAVDTKTSGLDIVIDHKANLGAKMKLTNTLAFTFSKTNIENINVPTAVADAGLSETYFDQTSRIYIESAVPRVKGNLSHNLSISDKWNVFLRNAYFGEVEEATNNTDPAVDRIYGGKIITDLSVGYNFSNTTRFTIGANNLLDVYSDQSDAAFRSSGRFIWSRRSQQFGTGGRFLFARLNFTLK